MELESKAFQVNLPERMSEATDIDGKLLMTQSENQVAVATFQSQGSHGCGAMVVVSVR